MEKGREMESKGSSFVIVFLDWMLRHAGLLGVTIIASSMPGGGYTCKDGESSNGIDR